MKNNDEIGKKLYSLVKEFFPIGRSLTEDGVRQTLAILDKIIPLTVHEVKFGTHVFDWTVPREWNIRNAYIEDEKGNRGLYPTISTKTSTVEVENMIDFISYADGENDLIDISNKTKTPAWELYPIAEKLMKESLLTVVTS